MAPRKLLAERPLLDDPPSASSSDEEENPGDEEEEETPDQQAEEEMKTATHSHPLPTPKEEKKHGCGAIHRLWSEDDEITILEGMINYHSKRGTDPYSEIGEFHEFIKNSLSFDASKRKFVDKVRKMKVKYKKNVEKGKRVVFSEPHSLKCFELSKKIWGVGGGVVGKEKRDRVDGNEQGRIIGSEAETLPFDLSKNEPLGSFMMANMSMIGRVKAKELKKKWKDLLVDEVAIYLKRVELVKECTELIGRAQTTLIDELRPGDWRCFLG
ncbi:hypothetical protein Vadar_014838 [Vaccinium darrowii]|uniref:Uncharacterized protein n=1 Tax=Vaccinium darrowii TaxID=229202 RepID=A0ACB7XAU8_9ERIC|nr:hypothetical protein Vadar_014838 [Vaccinium darrowii]